MNNRRKLVVALGAGTLAWTCTLHAQAPARVLRIGVLSPFSPSESAQALQSGLRERGWVEGKNLSIDYRYADGRSDRLPALATDLIGLQIDVIVTVTSPAALAAQKVTKVIPIVMAAAGEPVSSGLVESLARPGGNITGLSQMAFELGGKRLELLKEIVPKLSRVAVLWNPEARGSTLAWKELQLPARQLSVQLHSLEVRTSDELDNAFEDAIRARVGALVTGPDPVLFRQLRRIADFAAKNGLPSIYHLSEFADAGGLLTYGTDRTEMFRQAATYVDKIFKGAKAADLPVEQRQNSSWWSI